MRKIALLLLTLLTAASAWAAEFSDGDLMYSTLSSNTVSVTGLSTTGRGKSGLYLEIPSTVTYSGTIYRVESVAANAFKGQSNISYVRFYWGVTTINGSAFENCTNLANVRLASSVNNFGASAFAGCSKLATVYYPSFTKATAIWLSTWPDNKGMALHIPYGSSSTTTDYKNDAYWGKFASVTADDEAYEFMMSDGGLYTVGRSDNNGPDATRDLTMIGYRTTGSTTADGTVYSAVGGGSFSVRGISYKVTSIGTWAFTNQTTVQTITIPGTVTTISNTVNFVSGATALTAINVVSGNTNYSSYDGCLYSKSGQTLYRVPPAKTSISYNPAVTTIGTNSHNGCAKLASARLPYGVKQINNYAFANTAALDYVFIPASVTSLAKSAFNNTRSNIFVYCNMATPPTITMSDMFGSNVTTTSGSALYVPYGQVDAYKSAGWNGFQNYNRNSIQSYDFYQDGLAYTVTNTASVTASDGKAYSGRVKVVCAGNAGSSNTDITTVNVPAGVTYNGKTYAVTKIGEDAFNNHATPFTVTGCENVDTIAEYAFDGQPLKNYPFRHNLRMIGNYAFRATTIDGTICLPFGVRSVGNYAFANSNLERLVIPRSVGTIWPTFCANSKYLKELVINLADRGFYNGNWTLGSVPATCYIRVPVGVVNQWKTNADLSSRSAYITAGAYDFAHYNTYTGITFVSIVSNSPVTRGSTTYAGTAKYVYHPNIQNDATGTYSMGTSERDYTQSGDSRYYLITEVGDSLLCHSKCTAVVIPSTITKIGHDAFWNSAIANNNLVLPEGLTTIGSYAFSSTKLTGEVKVPATVTSIGANAFNTGTLGSLYFPDVNVPTLGKYVWNTGNDNFTVWVPNGRANAYLTAASGWGTAYAAKLAPWFKAAAANQMFSSVLPVDLAGSAINAYYASAYDRSRTGQELTLSKANQAPAKTGLLITDLTSGNEYRIKRPAGSVSAPMTNYFADAADAGVNVYNQSVGYYLDGTRFTRPTGSYTAPAGTAYLKLSNAEAGGLNTVYTNLWPNTSTHNFKRGDVNGDNIVDTEDMNAVINIMLKKATAASYNGEADVDQNGIVDIDDMNLVLNIMLKKASSDWSN